MNVQSNERVIHSYDTERHRVRCGRSSQQDSTKHARDVTCVTCLGLLRAQQAVPAEVELPTLGEWARASGTSDEPAAPER